MKIAVVSDIHSNIYALQAVFEKIDEMGVDEIWCCGDIVGYSPFPKQCLDLIRRRDVFCVMGNHDFAVVNDELSWFKELGIAGIHHNRGVLSKDDLSFLGSLPKNKLLNRDNCLFYICHGSPRDNLFEYIQPWADEGFLRDVSRFADADFIVMGHTHVQMEAEVDGVVFLNAGSVGFPRDGIARACFMVFDTEKKRADWVRVGYDVEAMVKAVVDSGLPFALTEKLKNGR